MDNNHIAIQQIEHRAADFPGLLSVVAVHGDPVDLEGARKLAKDDPDEFQDWVGRGLGASGKHKRGGDSGVDDRIRFHDGGETHLVVLSVKGGETVGPKDVRELSGAAHHAALGVLVCFERTKKMEDRAAAEGFWLDSNNRRWDKLQIITVEEMLAGREIQMPSTTLGADVPQNQRYHDVSMQGKLFPQ